MLRLWKKPAGHEEAFTERYDRLVGWAMQIAEGDAALAEDLVHDAFIQFTLARPDLGEIANLDSYIYGVLRNLHLSHLRKAARRRLTQLSIVEYESAELGLCATDAGRLIQVHDELRRVCRFACDRKETARAGSVLILRFFHGYYPSEIAQILRCTRQAVDIRLGIARNEARAILEEAPRLRVIGARRASADEGPLPALRGPEDFLLELREMIFGARQGKCLARAEIRALYCPASGAALPPLDCRTLGHIVSCRRCLDDVSDALRLAPLADRYPTDALGPEKKKGGSGGNDGGAGGGAGGASGRSLSRRRRRARETFEHLPKELFVAVNGEAQGSQKVIAERGDLTLILGGAEKIEFVEVFSEQDIRLLSLNVGDPPPVGLAERKAQVELSDGRALMLTLRFTSPWPTLRLLYEDPTFTTLEAARREVIAQDSLQPPSDPAYPVLNEGTRGAETADNPHPGSSFLARAFERVRGLFMLDFWLRPGVGAALLTIALIAAMLFVREPVRPSSAAELLRQSVAAEDVVAGRTDQALRREISLEERRANGELIARRKIGVWRSAERGVTARRLYDEAGQLIAGEWRKSDGVRAVYYRRAQQQGAATSSDKESAPLTLDNLWLLEPSVRDFTALVGAVERAVFEERKANYVITYQGQPAGDARGLVQATLTLSRADLHAVEQTLVARHEGELRQYRFLETSYERRPVSAVAPAVFEPDAELLSGGPVSPGDKAASLSSTPESVGGAPAAVIATTELEIEALRLLNQAGADLGEQISMERTSEGRLRIQGITDTAERKSEILRALAPVSNHPAVKIEVSTAAEAAARQARQLAGPVKIEQVAPAEDRIPTYHELRRHFAARETPESQMDAEISRFAIRVSARARQALQRAWALKRLAGRFSEEDLRSLNPEAREKWLDLIRAHARACEQEVKGLRQELQPVFPTHSADEGSEEAGLANDADLIRAAGRLLDLMSANDRAVRSAFTISTGTDPALALKTPQFWRGLRGAEKLAARIIQVH